MFKFYHILNMYRFRVAEYIDYYRYCNGCLGCGNTYSEHCEEETFEMLGMAVCVEDCKVYINSIQHKLGAYEKRYKVASCEKTEYSDEEENGCKNQIKFSRYYHSCIIFFVQS